MNKEKEMTYEEKQEKLEKRLENQEIDYNFNHMAESVTVRVFGSNGIDSSLFAGLDEEFIGAKGVVREREKGVKQAGVELDFQL